MRKVFERMEEAPLLEQQIWGHVVVDCGDFGGIRELGMPELVTLKALTEARIFILIDEDQQKRFPLPSPPEGET